jgi:hypothetical protein
VPDATSRSATGEEPDAASVPAGFSYETTLKVALMGYIDGVVRRRYGTLRRACESGGVDYSTLSRIRHQHCRRVSLSALLRISEQLGIQIKIGITLCG